MARTGAGGFRRRTLSACALILLGSAIATVAAPNTARAESRPPLTRLSEVGPALMACWRPPPGSEGAIITLRFGLTVEGRLKGPPLATYSRLTGTRNDQRAFLASALEALDRCTPLAMEPGLARIVASRVLTLTFAVPAPSLAI